MQSKDQNNTEGAEVVLFVKVSAKPASVEKARQALLDDVNGARTEDGNIRMELYQADGQPDNFYLFERWKNRPALEHHFAQPYTAGAFELQKQDLTAPIEMNYLTELWPDESSSSREPHRQLTTLIVPFETKPGCAGQFMSLFESFVPLVRQEAGNINFHLLKVNDSENRFVLYERWENQQSLDNHNQLTSTSELVAAVTLLVTKPVFDFILFARDIS